MYIKDPAKDEALEIAIECREEVRNELISFLVIQEGKTPNEVKELIPAPYEPGEIQEPVAKKPRSSRHRSTDHFGSDESD